ncbi:mitochondrial-like Rho GTPase 1-like [Trifolium medium]|uniref:Mitochondrial-like Rho GTPase 1-like n=1 Tax=Trifolium medium TaxID=97028 RepID=A0A392MKD2_9FABA|nr:mitochondrial-like Rho GTPase 1-like [Trifolium medium]
MVSQDMEVEAHMPISVKLGDCDNIFRGIVTAAEHPHLSIPKIESGKTRKLHHKLIDGSLMFVSVVLGVAVMVGVARKNAS